MNTQIPKTDTVNLFEKRTVAELTETEMMQIDGGTSPVCLTALYSSNACAIGAFGAMVYIGRAISA